MIAPPLGGNLGVPGAHCPGALERGDGVAAKYSALAGDGTLGPKTREAAILLSAAELSLNEEDNVAALSKAREALALFREVGDRGAVADALRLVVSALCDQEAHEEAIKLVTKELEAFRAEGERRGEAGMLLSLADINLAVDDTKKREEAFETAATARQIYADLQDSKMEGVALLAVVNGCIVKGTKHDSRRELEKAMAAAHDALGVFRRLQDRNGEAKALHGLAVAHSYVETWEEALRFAEQALGIWRNLGVRRFEGMELRCIGEWQLASGEPEEALKAGEAALNIFEELGNTKGWEAAAWGTVVRAHLGKQDYTTALRLAKDAFRSFQSRADEAGELAARSLEVEVNLAKDDKVEALRAAEKCLDGVRGISKRTTADRRFEASILHMVAQIQLAEEDFSKASETGRDALRLFQDCAEKQHQALVLQTLSNVCIGLKEYREAVKLATESRDIFRKRGHRRGHAYACLACCHAYCARGEHNRGISMGKEALKIFTEEKHRKGEANAYAVLGEVYLLKGNGQKALSNAKEALVAFKELGQPHRVLEELFIVAKAAFLAASEGGVPQAKGQKPSPAWDNALQAAQEALATARRQGTERSVVAALFGIGQVYVITRRPDDASKIIEEALPLAQKLGDDRAEANFEILAAQMHIMNGRDERAVEPARRAIEIFKDKLQDTEGESAASEIIRYVEGGGGGPAEVSIGAEDSQAAGAVQEYQGPSMEDLVATISDVALSLMGVESLAADTPLMDAGLDSLASVEFQNNLQKEFVGVQMPSTLVFDFPSVNTMAEFIYGGMREAAGFKPVSN